MNDEQQRSAMSSYLASRRLPHQGIVVFVVLKPSSLGDDWSQFLHLHKLLSDPSFHTNEVSYEQFGSCHTNEVSYEQFEFWFSNEIMSRKYQHAKQNVPGFRHTSSYIKSCQFKRCLTSKVSNLKSISKMLRLYLDLGYLEGFLEIKKYTEIASCIPFLLTHNSNKSKIPTQSEGCN